MHTHHEKAVAPEIIADVRCGSQSRHFDRAPLTSGLPRLADILRVIRHVSKVPTMRKEATCDYNIMGEVSLARTPRPPASHRFGGTAPRAQVRCGSNTEWRAIRGEPRSTPMNGHRQTAPTGPFRATKRRKSRKIRDS